MTRTTKTINAEVVKIASESDIREDGTIAEVGEVLTYRANFPTTSKKEAEKIAKKRGELIKWHTATVLAETRQMADDVWFKHSEVVDGCDLGNKEITD